VWGDWGCWVGCVGGGGGLVGVGVCVSVFFGKALHAVFAGRRTNRVSVPNVLCWLRPQPV